MEGLPWNIQLPAIPLNVRSVRYHIELLYECHMSRSSSGYHNPYFYPPFEPFEPLRWISCFLLWSWSGATFRLEPNRPSDVGRAINTYILIPNTIQKHHPMVGIYTSQHFSTIVQLWIYYNILWIYYEFISIWWQRTLTIVMGRSNCGTGRRGMGPRGLRGPQGPRGPQLVLRMRPTHIAMEMAHVLMIYHDLSIKNGDFHSYEF